MKMKRFSLFLAAALLLSFLLLPAQAESGILISVSDGDVFSGNAEISFFSPEAEGLAVLLDGKEIEYLEKEEISIYFSTTGVDYSGSQIRIGEKQIGSLTKNSPDQTFVIGRTLFGNGIFDVFILPSTGSNPVDFTKVYGTYNIDDMTVEAISAVLANGETVSPAEITFHYPIVGASGTRDEREAYAEEKITVGDGWNAETNLGGTAPDQPIALTLHFDLRENASFQELIRGSSVLVPVDTTAYSDGKHEFTFRSAAGEQRVSVVFDNTAPVISVPIENGALLAPSDKISVSVDDEKAGVIISIDGKRYFGKTVGNAISKTANTHLLTVESTDPYGNKAYLVREFRVGSGNELQYHPIMEAEASVSDIAFSGEGKLLKTDGIAFTQENHTLTLTGVSVGDNLILEYRGESSEANRIAFSVLNVRTGAYEQIRLLESGETVYIEFQPTEETVKDGTVVFKTEEYVYESQSDTIVWISDTQYYTRFSDLLSEYKCDLDYYTELYQKGEAGFLIHTGDVADDYSPESLAREQMKAASDLHKELESKNIPYGIVDGNHDTGHHLADSKYFCEVFGSSRFDGTSWFYGNLDDNTHHYDLVTLDGQDFLFVWLGYGCEADPMVVEWTKAVLSKYPDRNVIILTHAYLDVDNDWVIHEEDPTSYLHSRAKEIWEQYVVPYDNVIAVFCGHTPGVGRNLRRVDEKRSVWEVLADYQFVDVKEPTHIENNAKLDGEGYIRLVSFRDGKMIQKTYSPFLDDWNCFAPEKDEFTVDMPLKESTRTFTDSKFSAYRITGVLDVSPKNNIPETIRLEGMGIVIGEKECFRVQNVPVPKEPENSFPGWALVLIVAIIAAAGLTIGIVCLKRKKAN